VQADWSAPFQPAAATHLDDRLSVLSFTDACENHSSGLWRCLDGQSSKRPDSMQMTEIDPRSAIPETDAASGKPGGSIWSRPLRTLLSLSMVAMLIIVSFALVGLDFHRARKSALDEAKDSMRVFADRIVDRLGVISGDTVTIVNLVANVANSLMTPPPERLNDKIAMLREATARSSHIDGVFVGYPDGSFFHVIDLHSQGWRTALNAPERAKTAVRTMEADQSGKRFSRVIFLDADGNRIDERAGQASGYDPRTRPWYQAALNRTDPVSVGPYQMATTGALGMTVSRAHRGNKQIVVGADVVLDTITDFLAAERMSPDTVAFIVDASGNPIIHSDHGMMERIVSPKKDDDSGPSVASDPLIASVHTGAVSAAEPSLVDVAGRTYLVAVIPIRSALLLAGDRVVVAAPLDELTASAKRGLLQGLSISAVVVMLAILCALMVARWVTKSLHLLTASAHRLQNLDFTTPIAVPSHVKEISTLGGAMNRARNAIFTFGLYVPKELVRKGIQSGTFGGRSARRQEVTALFTDIYDFTTISERYAPEEVVAMLSEYFDIFSEIVNEHGGTIIQFLGDSVFAMWNAPVPDEKHAEHACRYALAVEERLRVFNEEQRAKGLPEFRTRFGIHTGPAVVGSVGAKERLQYTAMGDTVNVASRLEGINKTYGTTILASGAVAALCSDAISFRPLGSAQAKGRKEALEIYEVLAARSEPTASPRDAEALMHQHSA
jgi:adenylate cyclase